MTCLPKLTYFDVFGLGEPIRLINVVTGNAFEDKRVSFADWPAMKEAMPNKQMPVWEEGDGVVMAESSAILNFLARKYEMEPTDSHDAYNSDVICQVTNDINTSFRGVSYLAMRPEMFGHYNKTPEEIESIKKMLADDLNKGPLHQMLTRLNQVIVTYGLMKDGKVSKSDCFVAGRMAGLFTGLMAPNVTVDLEKYPNLNKFWKDFNAIESVKKYWAKKA